MVKLSILRDFSRVPGPRYISEGAFSGELFRKEILLPKVLEAIKSNDKLEINLDGVSGYGTSFLEEAFGGLIRTNHIDYCFLENDMILISKEDPDYIEEIKSYLRKAQDDLKKAN